MGFFSFNCRGCGHPMLSHMAITRKNGWMNDAVALKPNGTNIVGSYDGYGRVGEYDCYEGADFWHQRCWELAGRPAYQGRAESASDQGWFFDDKDHAVAEPKSLKDVAKARAKAKKLEARRKEATRKALADWEKAKRKAAKEESCPKS